MMKSHEDTVLPKEVHDGLTLLMEARDRFLDNANIARQFPKEQKELSVWNAQIGFWVDMLHAMNVLKGENSFSARKAARRTVREELVARCGSRDLSLVELRALAVGAAYRENIRSAYSGHNDSRMEAALFIAARFEGLEGEDPVGAMRKSLTRHRKNIRGKKFVRLNVKQLELNYVDAEASLFADFPGTPGRPKSVT